MDDKQINLQVMEIRSVEEIEELIGELKKIKGHAFLIQCQFKIKNEK